MNIRNQLLKAHSKLNATFISDFIGNDKVKFDQLVKLFLANESRVTQRAAYSLSISIDKYPSLLDPYIGILIGNLDNINLHIAVIRNTVRVLQNIEIPKRYEGKLTTKCFDYLTDNNQPKAVKVFSMTILANMAKKYPELKNELILIIKDLMEFGSPGILSRGKKVINQLNSATT